MVHAPKLFIMTSISLYKPLNQWGLYGINYNNGLLLQHHYFFYIISCWNTERGIFKLKSNAFGFKNSALGYNSINSLRNWRYASFEWSFVSRLFVDPLLFDFSHEFFIRIFYFVNGMIFLFGEANEPMDNSNDKWYSIGRGLHRILENIQSLLTAPSPLQNTFRHLTALRNISGYAQCPHHFLA